MRRPSALNPCPPGGTPRAAEPIRGPPVPGLDPLDPAGPAPGARTTAPSRGQPRAQRPGDLLGGLGDRVQPLGEPAALEHIRLPTMQGHQITLGGLKHHLGAVSQRESHELGHNNTPGCLRRPSGAILSHPSPRREPYRSRRPPSTLPRTAPAAPRPVPRRHPAEGSPNRDDGPLQFVYSNEPVERLSRLGERLRRAVDQFLKRLRPRRSGSS